MSGGSGLIGTALQRAARAQGHEIGLLVRGEASGPGQWAWDPAAGRVPADAIAWADGVVNLSGAPLGRLPWTKAYRREIVHSRVHATRTLASAISASDAPPSVFVSGSAVGFYGDRPGEQLDETSGHGRGFLAYVCRRWEAEAREAASPSTRVVTIRTGLVLADGGALEPLMLATGLGLGARIGAGTQIWPWIALADEVGAILHTLTHDDVAGPVDLVAPASSTSEDVTRTLADVMGRPHLFVLPAWLLRLPLGPTADEMLLLSQDIRPTALLDSGYRFTTPDLRDAVEDAVNGVSEAPEPAQPEPAGDVDDEAYEEQTVAELRERAKALGLAGYSRKTKAELIAMLRSR